MKNQLAMILISLYAIAPLYGYGAEVQLPDNAQLAWVSHNINQDGMLLDIQTFHSDNTVESVMSFYREVWFTEGEVPGFVENKMDDWSIISQLRDNSNVVIQLKPSENGSSTGFLSIAKKHHGAARPKADFPVPDSTEPFSTSYVEEDDARIHTMTFLSTQSVGNTVTFYRTSMIRKGWKLAKDKMMNGSQIMIFNRNGDRCELVVSRFDSESTVIHVNQVKRNG